MSNYKQVTGALAKGIVAGTVVIMIGIAVMMANCCFAINNAVAPESATLNSMQLKYLTTARNDAAMAQRIRVADFELRRNWFILHDRLRKGALFLFLATAIICGSIYIMQACGEGKYRFPGLRRDSERDRGIVRTGIVTVGIMVIFATVIFAFTSYRLNMSKDASENVVTSKPDFELVETPGSWTGFRGTLSYGASSVHRLPLPWDTENGKNILWKTGIPLPGYNSPIVYNNKIFLTGADAEHREVFCFDAASGKLLWRYEVKSVPPVLVPKVSDDTGYAASTMAAGGNSVYAAFATGELVCLDFNGQLRWSKNLGAPSNVYGYSSSLRAIGNMMIMQFDDENRQRLLAFEEDSGNVIWETERKSAISWSSPVTVKIDDNMLIVILTGNSVEAYDLRNGRLKWEMRGMGGEVATSAAFANGKIFVANDNAGAAAIDSRNGNIIWKSTELTLPDVASPLAVDNMLYLFNSHGVIQCVDADSGKLLWEKEGTTGYYSSPLLVGGKIIAVNLEGKTVIIAPSREKYQEDAVYALGDKIFATPAFADDRMIIRSNSHLYAIGLAKP